MKYLCDNCSPKIGCINRFQNKKTECDSYVPMNNEQFIRFCDTEQLAEVLADVSLWIHPFMKQKNRFELLKKQFYDWLKQTHTNE